MDRKLQFIGKKKAGNIAKEGSYIKLGATKKIYILLVT